MKNYLKIALVAALPLAFSSCELLSSLTNSDVVAGLKEALTVSTDTSTTKLSATNKPNASAEP